MKLSLLDLLSLLFDTFYCRGVLCSHGLLTAGYPQTSGQTLFPGWEFRFSFYCNTWVALCIFFVAFIIIVMIASMSVFLEHCEFLKDRGHKNLIHGSILSSYPRDWYLSRYSKYTPVEGNNEWKVSPSLTKVELEVQRLLLLAECLPFLC